MTEWFSTLLIALLGGLSIPGLGAAQNHPELDWRVLETAHFRIYYHQGLEHIAQEAATISEKIYGPVTSLYHFEPKDKVHFVFRDDEDYSNGLTYYYDNMVVFWVTPLHTDLRGVHPWLWNVITHEFTHIVSLQVAMKAPRRFPAAFMQVFGYQHEPRKDVLRGYPDVLLSYPLAGTAVPMWFAEGVAQYQAKGAHYDGWDSHRDMILRVGTLEGKLLSFDDMGVFSKTSLGNEMVYNYGLALVSFIAERYGDEALGRIFEELSRPFSGIGGAIQKVLGISARALDRQWRTHLRQRYEVQTREVRAHRIEGECVRSKGYVNAYPRWSPDGNHLIYLSNQGQDYWLTSLYLFLPEEEKDTFLRGGVTSSASWMPDGKTLLFARRSPPNRYGSRFWDLYRYDLEKKQEKRLTYGLRARFPQVSPDGRQVLFVRNGGGSNNLGVLDLDDGEIRYLTYYEDGTQIYGPRWSPDGQRIVFSIVRGDQQDIGVMGAEGDGCRLLIASKGSDRDPCWTPDGRAIVFASDVTGIFNLYVLDLERGQIQQVTNVLGGAFYPDVSPDGRLAFSMYGPDGFEIRRLPSVEGWREVDASLFVPSLASLPLCLPVGERKGGGTGESFSAPLSQPGARSQESALRTSHFALRTLQSVPYEGTFLGFSVMPRVVLDEDRPKIGLYLSSRDVLEKHSLFGGIAGGAHLDMDGFVLYEYKALLPTVFLEYYKQLRHVKEGLIDSVYDLKVNEVSYDLNELDLGLRHTLAGKHKIQLGVSLSLYNAKEDRETLSSRMLYNLRYTYLKGIGLSLTYEYVSFARARDEEINPRGGRFIRVRYDRFFNHYLKGFRASTLLEERYEKFFYDQVTLDWREYMALPWGRHTLGLRLNGGWIDRKVNNFFNLYLGGLPGLKGYTFYSLEGRKVIQLGLTYRFPMLRDIRKKVLHLYFDKVYGAVFADVGRAWDEDRLNFEMEGFKKDIGGQIRMDVISFYGYPTALQVDVAYGMDEDGGRSPWKTYLMLLLGYIN